MPCSIPGLYNKTSCWLGTIEDKPWIIQCSYLLDTIKPKLVVAGSEPAKRLILSPGNLESTDYRCKSLRLGSDPRGAHSSGEMVKDRTDPAHQRPGVKGSTSGPMVLDGGASGLPYRCSVL